MRKRSNSLQPTSKSLLSCTVTVLSLSTMVFFISGMKDLLSDDTMPSSSDANFSLQLNPTQKLCIGVGSFFTMILVCKCAQHRTKRARTPHTQLLNHSPIMTVADEYMLSDTKEQSGLPHSV